jgi:hypothetical protein
MDTSPISTPVLLPGFVTHKASMAPSTLALGQASYELLDALVTTSSNRIGTKTETIRAETRGGLIEGVEAVVAFGNRVGDISVLNVADQSSGLSIADADVSTFTTFTGGLDARINLLSSSEESSIALGQGDNQLFAAKNLLSSSVSAGLGDDTVRIGGSATGTELNLGDGNNSVLISKNSVGVDVNVGGGSDTLLFLGSISAGLTSDNIVNTRSGDDILTFTGGVKGGVEGEYLIQTGAGEDTVIFGYESLNNNFELDTSEGSDFVALGRSTENADISFGAGSGSDTLILGMGADITNSDVHSSQTGGDLLYLYGNVVESDFYLSNGGDIVGLFGAGSGSIFDLGYDDSTDQVILTDDSFMSYNDIVISNFGEHDILIIGDQEYSYADFSGYDYDSTLGQFLIGNQVFFKNGPSVM